MDLLCEDKFVVEKFAGKGGWTYVLLPGIAPDSTNPFGWIQVRGFVNTYEIKQAKLMPFGKGMLFLPLKADIRKRLSVKEGDTVFVKLWKDNLALQMPQEILDCLQLESRHIQDRFYALSEAERRAFVNWIISARNDETRVRRIVEMMRKLERGEGFYFSKSSH
jgi:hypothetical protein